MKLSENKLWLEALEELKGYNSNFHWDKLTASHVPVEIIRLNNFASSLGSSILIDGLKFFNGVVYSVFI